MSLPPILRGLAIVTLVVWLGGWWLLRNLFEGRVEHFARSSLSPETRLGIPGVRFPVRVDAACEASLHLGFHGDGDFLSAYRLRDVDAYRLTFALRNLENCPPWTEGIHEDLQSGVFDLLPDEFRSAPDDRILTYATEESGLETGRSYLNLTRGILYDVGFTY